MQIQHPVAPIFDKNSRILILGTFPSVKSREAAFFYSHPQNRFWKVMAAVLGEVSPQTMPQKQEMLLRHGIALWDVIASCEVTGSSDSSIRNVVPTDLTPIFAEAKIRQIFVNGKTALRYYDRYQRKLTGMEAVCLPSTSPANAAWSLERLITQWRMIVNK